MTEELIIEGWKGTDNLQINSSAFDDCFILHEHRKNKETGLITEQIIKLPIHNVQILWSIIKENCDLEDVYGYQYIVRHLLRYYKLALDIDAWNGGRNRSKFYFPLHYYPLKVLEAKGFIKYFGHGGVQRLR